MKIVVAPDSFKGSVSAPDLCRYIKEGIHSAIPDAEVVELPLADGGEGIMENLVHSSNGTIENAMVTDPIGRTIQSAYGVLGDHETAIIEMAQASGLPLLTKEERNPMRATSYGTGELIKQALDDGYRKFIIGIGGSATNDGGIGCLHALGLKFLDSNGEKIHYVQDLHKLESIDDQFLDERIHSTVFTIASDVDNVLCGKNGASSVFGPQKGATPEMVEILDQNLYHYGKVVHRHTGVNVLNIPGSGAAGGLGAAFMAFLHPEFKPGIQVVMEASQFEEKIKDADFIITGEGRLDQQTLSGKVIAGIAKAAEKLNIPVLALCGSLDLKREDLNELGLISAFSIVQKPCSLEEAIEYSPVWIREQTINIMKIMQILK